MRTLLFSLVLFSSAISAAEKPDIIMIAVDDLRPMLSCYGDERIATPNIDKLASRGVLFERAYCQYAKCGTSRLSLMTGLRPDTVNVFSNSDRDLKRFHESQPDSASIARWLKEKAGYHTQSWGKIYHDGWDNPADWSVPSSPGRDHEMLEIADKEAPQNPTVIADRWDCPVIQRPDVTDDHLFAGRMTRSVTEFLKKRDSIEKPVFLAVGYRRPHLPFVAPKRYFDEITPNDTWLAKNPEPTADSPVMAWFNSDGYVGGAKRIGLSMPTRPNRQQGIAWNGYEMRSYVGVPPKGAISKKLQLDLLHAYAACVRYVDAQIGKLLENIDDSTVVILWSDHGWHLGEQSAWGKMTNFEIATRVPLIIAHPDIEPGRTKSLAELVDLYPTICDLVNTEKPAHIEGESLLSILKEPAQPSETLAFSQYARYKGQYMGYAMRTDRYRLVIWKDLKAKTVVARELYDHETDSSETKNLAKQNAELTATLESQLWANWK